MHETKNGITLIALVITIVILIILAVVAIGAIFGEGGLIERANYGKKESEKADAREQLELVLADAYVEKNINEEYNQDEFLDDFIYERKPEAEVMEEEISLNGYTFELDRSVPKLGDYIGEAGNLPPVIRKINVTNKTLSEVSVEVITARAEGATYRYSYKKEVEEDTEYQQVAEKEENTNTYSGLESRVVYNLKVELIKDNQVIDEEVVNVMLGELEEGSLTFGKESWSNGTASLPVSTTTNMQIQYQINGIDEGSWTTIENNGSIPNIANGADVYARLWDGTNGSEYISRRIVDEIKPTLSYTINPETEGAESVTITVTAVDNESGIASITTPSGEQTKTGTTATATHQVTENGEYTFTAKDGGGNISEVLKVKVENIKVEVKRAETEGDVDILWVNESNQVIEKPDTPKLSEGMVPVKYEENADGQSGKWIKTTQDDPEWYNYENKEWANIVLTPTSGANEGKDADGDTDVFNTDGSLNEDSNYTMLVWIPRYAYKITYYNADKSQIIGYSNSDGIIDASGKLATGTKKEGAIEIGDKYVLHPAFNYGNSNENKLRGFWVGKYETSNTGCTTSESTGDKTYTGSEILQIKAGVTSWRNIQVNNIYMVCTEMNKSGNPYGLSTSDSVVDPHMVKNTEWGAVAYLSKSRYGKETEEVWKNPNSNYITGQAGSSVSASSTTSTSDYKSTNGQKASTTGNTTGVYDMSGGAWEYVAGYVNNGDSSLTTYGSNLVNGEARYKDVYSKGTTDTNQTNYEANAGKYGDAVYETSEQGAGTTSWYLDTSSFPNTSATFFMRSGSMGSSTAVGMFYFATANGIAYNERSFRVVVPVL